MSKEENQSQMDETIQKLLDSYDSLPKDDATALKVWGDNVTKLYEQRATETKNDNDYIMALLDVMKNNELREDEMKLKQTELELKERELNITERDIASKEKQSKYEWFGVILTAVVTAGVTVFDALHDNSLMKRILKFEETGSITTAFGKTMLSRILRRK